MRFLLPLFLAVPILEMYILIEVGQVIGAGYTIGLVVLTAILGAGLLRQQGLATLMRGTERLQGGQLPAREMAEGILLAVGGALLLTPGFVTDAFGFALLIPWSRRWLATRMLRRVQVTTFGPPPGGEAGPGYSGRAGPGRDGQEPRMGETLDGEYEVHEDRDAPAAEPLPRGPKDG